MYGKKRTLKLVALKEMYELIDYVPYSDMEYAREIYYTFMEKRRYMNHLNFYWFLAWTYNIGRLQGIREERAKKKGLNIHR